MKRWLIRIAVGLLALVVILVAGGAAWEAISRRAVRRDIPPTGKLVDIGGRRIHVDCRGTGTPTVVLIHGLDNGGALSWSAVHDSIAATTRTCAYSRAGIMWSDPGPALVTAKGIADDLHAALEKGGEHPPFVLVAHSLGGPLSLTYTQHYGDQVAGIVMVDIAHPDELGKLEKVAPKIRGAGADLTRWIDRLSWTGVLRLLTLNAEAKPNESAASARAKAAYLPRSTAAMLKETLAFPALLDEAGTFRTLGDRPLVILTATKPLTPLERSFQELTEAKAAEFKEIWRQLHVDATHWSTRSRQVLVPDASHYIQYDRPDVVIAAARSVIDSVRVAPGDSTAPSSPLRR